MFELTADWVALGLLALVLPVYHAFLPILRTRGDRFTTGKRVHREIESWVRHTLNEGTVIVAVQQCRNLTMIASALASSTLIIMTLGTSFLLTEGGSLSSDGTFAMDPLTLKGLVLCASLAFAFTSFVHALISLGRFTIMIALDKKTLDRNEGDAVIFLTLLFRDAVRSYRIGMHFLSALLPVLFWLYDPYLCIAVTVLLGIKIVLWEDFTYLWRKRTRPDPNHRI